MLVLIILLFNCCTKRNARIVEVNFSKEMLDVSDQFSEIEFLPVETVDENLVRDITKVLFVDSTYIIFSGLPDNMVAAHDINGRFVRKFGGIGRGPGEHVALTSISIDHNINVYDRGKREIKSFTKQGNFIMSLKNVGYFSQFEMIKKTLILFDSNERMGEFQRINLDKKLNVFDISDKIHPKLVFSDIDKKVSRQNYMHFSLPSLELNDSLYYWTFPGKSISALDISTLEKKVLVNFDLGDKSITDDILDKPWKDVKGLMTEIYKNNLFYLEKFYSLKRNVYCFRCKDSFIGIEDNTNNEMTCYNKLQLFENKKIPPIKLKYKISMVGSIGNDRIVFAWEASDFIDYFKNAKALLSPEEWYQIQIKYPNLEKTLQITTPESNEILMISKLK